MIRILLVTAVALIGIAAIFFFSDQSGTDSHNTSHKFAEKAAEGIVKMYPSGKINQNVVTTVAKVLDYPIRKLAHLFIYFMLGLLFYTGLRFILGEKIRPAYALIVIFMVFLVACADEINQYFSAGRDASFKDVIIDTVGGTFGLYFFHIIKDFISHMKSLFRKQS